MNTEILISLLKKNTGMLPKKTGVFLVGGTVRDVILGRSSIDFDIVVLEHPRQYADLLADTFHGKVIQLGKPGNLLYRVVGSGITCDISPPKGDCIESDLLQRDFSINAIAYDLDAEKLVDPCNGVMDIREKTLRMISRQSFEMDPIRLLRAFRISATLKFTIEPHTSQEISKTAHRITDSSGERIHEELMKLFRLPNAHGFLKHMARTQLLFHVFPELNLLIDQPGQNLFHHTLDAFFQLESMLNHPEIHLPLADLVTITPLFIPQLKLAMLLHEIPCTSAGLPRRAHLEPSPAAGKKIFPIEAISKRIKLSNKEADFIRFMMDHHREPVWLFRNHHRTGDPSQFIPFFMRCRDRTPMVIVFSIANLCGKPGSPCSQFTGFSREMLRSYHETFLPRALEKPLITGDDLIDELGVNPSPAFKTVLRIIEEKRLNGSVSSRREAVDLARTLMAEG